MNAIKQDWVCLWSLYFLLHLCMTQVCPLKEVQTPSATCQWRTEGLVTQRTYSLGWQATKDCASTGWFQAGPGQFYTITSLQFVSTHILSGVDSNENSLSEMIVIKELISSLLWLLFTPTFLFRMRKLTVMPCSKTHFWGKSFLNNPENPSIWACPMPVKTHVLL